MGKGGKGLDPKNDEKKEVLIDGRLYDVTNFRHPGNPDRIIVTTTITALTYLAYIIYYEFGICL